MKNIKFIVVIILCVLYISSCKNNYPTSKKTGGKSTKTGLSYNNKTDENPFIVKDYEGQPEAPDIRYIEGGRVILGSFERRPNEIKRII